ncbi:DegT/DnrJ/EryC1/StrS family aminotransferase [Candidatus Woesearchaeota archaeon]|nr:DegT/DnrJ/EryC1/StrS family aminotransferase [Candidatus Woesearchaeota archaeon]
MDYKEECRAMLKVLTGASYVLFTTRCNESIKLAMQLVADLGRHIVLYQEEGGWLTYEKYIKQAGLEGLKMITDDGLIYEKELNQYDYDIVLLLNSMPGYAVTHDMANIYSHCLKNDIFLVNDVSGSIGSTHAKFGDVIVGSFNKAKPVDLGRGGFIATNAVDLFAKIKTHLEEEPEMDYQQLHHKLKHLDQRRSFLLERAKKVKEDLIAHHVVHQEKEGFNVIVRFEDDAEKEEIISYCDKNELEYTICPREIRILDDAISIEVKRLTGHNEN